MGDHVQVNRNTVYVVAMVGEAGARASLRLFLKRGHIAFFIAIEGRMFSLLVLLIDILLKSIDPCAPANTIVRKPDRRLPEGASILVSMISRATSTRPCFAPIAKRYASPDTPM